MHVAGPAPCYNQHQERLHNSLKAHSLAVWIALFDNVGKGTILDHQGISSLPHTRKSGVLVSPNLNISGSYR